MKTGLSKKQKTTAIYFNEKDDFIEIQTHNTNLKNRLLDFSQKYPDQCYQTDDDEQGGLTFEIQKGRFGFKLTPPYSAERRQAARNLAKKNIKNPKRTIK